MCRLTPQETDFTTRSYYCIRAALWVRNIPSVLSSLIPAFPLSVWPSRLSVSLSALTPSPSLWTTWINVLVTIMADRHLPSMLREQSPAAQRTAKKAEATADSLIRELTREEDRWASLSSIVDHPS